jgi:AcrR family transcriptional regulator
MARHKNFNREEKLVEAMTLFWQKGFAATSVNELVESLKINRFSLYQTYTDKASLYREALEYYLNHISLPAVDRLKSAEADLDTLKQFLRHFADIQREQEYGCFLQNAILERFHCDEQVCHAGNEAFTALESAFFQVLSQEQRRGRFDPLADIHKLSRFLVAQLQGIRVLGKAKQYTMVEDTVAVIFEWLDGMIVEDDRTGTSEG